jgi:hypothetical protein
VLHQVLFNHISFTPEAVNDCMLVIAQLTDWNALELFTENKMVLEMLRDTFLPHPQFRLNAFLCLDAIV